MVTARYGMLVCVTDSTTGKKLEDIVVPLTGERSQAGVSSLAQLPSPIVSTC